MSRSLLDDAFSHNVWATVRLIDTCGALTPEQLATSAPGTYGSSIATLRHLSRPTPGTSRSSGTTGSLGWTGTAMPGSTAFAPR